MAYNYPPMKALAIANAESEFIVNIKNPSATSTASGLFQFIDATFEGYCIKGYKLAKSLKDKNDPVIQVECASRMLGNGLEHHWNASKHVWSTYADKN